VPNYSAVGATLQDIAEAIPHRAWVSDPTGFTEYINSRGAESLDGPLEANLGWGWVQALHPDDAENVKLQWEHATRTVTPFEERFRIRGRDGQYRWYESRALPVRGDDGEVVKWIGTFEAVGDVARTNGESSTASTGGISERELKVLRLVASGHTNLEIARLIGVSLRTIEATRANLRKNWGLHTRADLVRFARESGIDGNGLS